MSEKVLFIDSAHPSLQDSLENMGFHCEYFPGFRNEDYVKVADEYSGFVIRSKIPIDKKILDASTQLKFIARVGAGMENIDATYAEKLGILCLNAPEGNRDAVAEQALGMLLALFNNLLKADAEVRQGVWQREENRGHEIKGKTIGIIGYGNTGAAFARKLAGFEARVLAYDKYKTGFGSALVEEADMNQIFEQADILSLHVPLTDETHYLVDENYLSRFSKSIYLINTSRGAVVKTAALIEALENGIVKGGCLDVLEYEKFSFEDIQAGSLPEAFRKLIARMDVILSPHIAGWTFESNVRMASVLAQKIEKAFR
ncbi:MAG: NAD(P)-dependent oxidoreductase [Bacteroidales bacterium]|nr:NAD(P)-dependent oxidoreductase [Bacteroidales bacterium]